MTTTAALVEAPPLPSPRLRFVQICFSVIFCFLSAGCVFGYAALKPVLIASGVYGELCDGKESYCAASDTRLNLMFTIATVVTNASALPVGYILDTFGPKKTCIGGAIIFALGNFVFGLQSTKVDTYLIGYALIAIGSPGIFFAQFHLSNAFPASSGTILAAITGAFDASSLPYVIYRELFEKRGGDISIRTFFWFYMIIPAIIIIQQLLIGPPSAYQRLAPAPAVPSSSEPDELIRSPRALFSQDVISSSFSRLSYHPALTHEEEEEEEEAGKEGRDGLTGMMFGKSVGEQIGSWWFWSIALFLFIQMIRINWYLATVQSQLEYYTGDLILADYLTKAFTLLLPLGGIVGIPFVGLLLDNRPTLEATGVVLASGLAFGILTMMPSTAPQLIGIGVLVFLRPLFYTYVSDAMAKIFGFANFGTVYGLAFTLSGFIGLSLTPMDILTKGPLHGNYTPINVVLLVAGFLTCGAVGVRVWWYTRKGAVRLEEEEE